MASQIEIQVEINRLITERTKFLKEQASLLKGQISLAAGLCKALDCKQPKEVTEAINEMSTALESAGEAAAEASDQNKKMGAAISRAFKDAATPMGKAKAILREFGKQFPIASVAVAGFVDGLISGFKFAVESIKSAFDIMLKLTGAVVGIGKAIISIPFKILSGLIETSNKLAEMMDDIRRATEEVRKEFGSLSSGPGQDVIQIAKDLSGTLTSTGLTGYKVFGNLAERMRFVMETAKGMGASFETVRHEMEGKTGAAILLMQKGLGLTGEDMGAVARQSMAMGKTFQSSLITITKVSTDFGKRFDLSAKLISRDMAMMVKDAQHFGNMGPIELAKVSVFTKKLGIDVKDLLGVIDKFDTFEDAAVSAAKLGQAFGVNVDAVKLMSAENPAERVQQLRDAFFAAGKSAENLTRQELKLLAQTSGLSEEAARTAFSQKNMGVSMQDLDKQATLSAKKQITQEQALVRLSDAIDRMVKSFGQFEGFLQAFTDGFARGVFVQKDFMGMLTKLRLALVSTKFAGIEVGKAFVEMFPGVQGLTRFLGKLFDTSSKMTPFSIMLQEITDAFKDFFKAIAGDPEALPRLFKRLKFEFESFLDSFDFGVASEEGNKFVKALGNIAAGAIRIIASELPKIVDFLVEFIKDPKMPTNIPGTGLAKSFIDPIVNELKKEGAQKKIVDSLKKLFNALWDKAQPFVEEIAEKIGKFMFGVALVKAATSALSFALTTVVSNWLGAGGGLTILSGLSSAATAIAGVIFNPAVWIPAAAIAVGAAAVGASEGMKKFKGKLDKEFGEAEANVGASVAGMVQTLSLGLVPDSLASQIGRFAAKATDFVLDAIESLPFGSALRKGWEEMIKSTTEAFASLGDLITSILSGDSAKIKASAQDFGGKVLKFFLEYMYMLPLLMKTTLISVGLQIGKWILEGLLWLVTDGFALFGEMTMKALDGVFQFVAGMIFEVQKWVEKIPIVGALLGPVIGFVGKLFETIGDVFGFAAEGFVQMQLMWKLMGTAVSEFADELWTSISGAISKVWDEVTKFMGFGDTAGEGFIMGIDKWLRDWPTKVWEAAKSVWSSITGFFEVSSPSKKFIELGVNMIQGMISGITSMGGALVDGFKNAISGFGSTLSDAAKSGLGAFKDVFGINSPSTVAADVGQSIIDGMMKSISFMPNMIMTVAEKGLTGLEGKFDKSNVAQAFEGFTSPMLAVVKGMVEETNEINKTLASLGPIDIDAKLKDMAEKLGVSTKELSIDRGDIKLHINLNVVMEADKVADAIIATKKVLKAGE